MECKIKELISRMTIEEKIGQLNMEAISLDGGRIEEVKKILKEKNLDAALI